MRLDKFLSNIGTRSEMKKLLKTGIVTVNDDVIKSGNYQVEQNDIVCINGEKIQYKEFVYIVINKPKGYVCANEDKLYPTVFELLDEKYERYSLMSVGRLDVDTDGLLLITNDGTFVHSIISPKKNITKRYYAELDIKAEIEDIEKFKNGIELSNFTAKPALLEICENPKNVYITVSEGKFHQVKRMCKAVGKEVVNLKRVSIGGLELPRELEIGESIEVDKDKLIEVLNNGGNLI